VSLAKSFSPTSDYEAHSNAQERSAETSKWYLWVWETFEITVEGLLYQIEVDATIYRKGEHGDIEFSNEGYRIKSIHVGLPQFEAAILLDEMNLREDHKGTWFCIEAVLDHEILKFASRSQKWEQYV